MNTKNVMSVLAMLLILLTTGCKKDENEGVTPEVVSTYPISNAIHVPINTGISSSFSVSMDSTTITSTSFTVLKGTSVVSGTISYIGTTATFTPAANLEPNTLYKATFTTGVKNKTGQALAQDYTWSFTSGEVADIVKPLVTVTNPLNNATGVALNYAITATFNKVINPATVTSLTFTLKQGTSPVSGVATCTGEKVTFTPTAKLEPNKSYTATITSGVSDLAGNALAANYAFSFTTGNAADVVVPTVSLTEPANNNMEVVRNKVIAITFSEDMDPSTINSVSFTLKNGTTAVDGSVSYSGKIATFTSSNLLLAGTTYTATISTGAKDLAGNALAANVVWSFKTKSATTNLAAVNLGAAGNYVILAKTAISNISTSVVTGDLGLSPAATSYVTGFSLTNATGYATSAQITGKIYAADMADPTPINLTTAVNNMLTAYTDAAGRPSPDFTELGTGNIGGKTLTPGLYKWTSTVTMPSDVTISGSSTDVWIFQIAENLTMSSGVKITLNGGAQAKNIFWQVAGQATLGTTSHFEGIILSKTGITFQTGASINGRALAQTAVALDGNAFTKPQ